MTKLAQLNFKITPKLLADFDKAWKENGRIPSRTAALQRAMESYIEQNPIKEAD